MTMDLSMEEMMEYRMEDIFHAHTEKQINRCVTFKEYLQIIFGQFNSQLLQLPWQQSEKLILNGLIMLKSDKDANKKRYAHAEVQVNAETAHKNVATDGQFIVEGARDVIKRAERMLILDNMINSEVEKACELFDCYSQLPMVNEFEWM